jgi:hypothetical protein
MVVDGDPSNDMWVCEGVRWVEGYQYDENNRPYVIVRRGGTVGLVVNVACGPDQTTTPDQTTMPEQTTS